MSEQAKKLIAQAKAENWKRLDIGNCGLTDLETQVPELFELEGLEELVVSGQWWDMDKQDWIKSVNEGKFNKLNQLPPSIARLKQLTTLVCAGLVMEGGISSNTKKWTISNFSVLSNLTQLTHLDLSYNQITDLSPLAQIGSLVSIDLSRNHITDLSLIPLVGLSNLRQLSLSSNQIADLSHLVGLKSLEQLDLYGNQISDPSPLSGLYNLKQLVLSGNQITNLQSLLGLSNLRKLDLNYNKVTNLSGLSDLPNLTQLSLNRNGISSLVGLSGLSNLRELALSDNQITDLSDLSDLPDLIQLNLSLNQISDLSPLLGLPNLVEVHLSFNKITDISPLLGLPNLTGLWLRSNQITNLPPLSGLPSLTRLDLSSNQITDISPLSGLSNLTHLDLFSNQITDISPLLPLFRRETNPMQLMAEYERYLLNSGKIGLMKNPLTTPPLEIIEQGTDTVLRYFEQLEESRAKNLEKYINREVKVIFVGNSGVGKTTLAKYLVENKLSNTHPSTHWMEISSTKLGDYEIRLFDFGGQEYYHDTHHLFFTNNTAYILLWCHKSDALGYEKSHIRYIPDGDLCEVDLYHFPLEYWLEAITFYTRSEQKKETPIFVVQSRVKTIVDILPLEQKTLMGKYANITHFSSASLNAYERNPFEEAQLSYLKEKLKAMLAQMTILDRTYPGTWRLIKEAIVDYTDTSIFLSIREFKDFCNTVLAKYGISFDENETKDVCRHLNEAGYLLYYAQTIPDKVFFNQKHITECVYKVLEGLEAREGKFDLAHVSQKLQGADKDKCLAIVQLMTQFKIVFCIDENAKTYIAPLYLPIEPLKAVKLFLGNFSKPKARFQYKGFVHKSVILNFFAKFGHDVFREENKQSHIQYYYWRNGIVVANPDDKQELVLVNFNVEKSQVDVIPFSERSKSDFLEQIIDKLKEINSGWNVEQQVTSNGTDFVSLEVIKKNEDDNYWTFRHNGKMYHLNDFKEYLKNKPLMQKLFISYSSKDIAYLKELEVSLAMLKRQGFISTWHDRKLTAGEEWDAKIKDELLTADVILMLLSPDFLASDYIWDIEVKTAIERHKKGTATVIPIILRPCEWEHTPFEAITTAQANTDPISTSPDRDTMWKKIVGNIREAITDPKVIRNKAIRNKDFFVFISYAPTDRNDLRNLQKFMAGLDLQIWTDQDITAGTDRSTTIQQKLDTADVVLLLISPNYLMNKEKEMEMERIRERQERDNILVIPVIVLDCMWEHTWLGHITPVNNGKPLNTEADRDHAFANAAREIEEAIKRFSPKHKKR